LTSVTLSHVPSAISAAICEYPAQAVLKK